MTEEKRLDESTLEKVSGGSNDAVQYRFYENNCHSCRKYNTRNYNTNTWNCPYGTIEDAFKELGSSPYAKCPYKEA